MLQTWIRVEAMGKGWGTSGDFQVLCTRTEKCTRDMWLEIEIFTNKENTPESGLESRGKHNLRSAGSWDPSSSFTQHLPSPSVCLEIVFVFFPMLAIHAIYCPFKEGVPVVTNDGFIHMLILRSYSLFLQSLVTVRMQSKACSATINLLYHHLIHKQLLCIHKCARYHSMHWVIVEARFAFPWNRCPSK